MGDKHSLWKKHAAEVLLDTPIYSVWRQPHEHPDLGAPIPFYLIDCADWVNIIGIDTDTVRDSRARMLWVKQFRVGTDSVTWELPGGTREDSDVEILESAKREFIEETGASATRWEYLGSMSPNAAFMRNQVHTFLALGARIDEKVILGDGREVLEPIWLPFQDRYAPLYEGKVNHALIAGALALLEAHLQRNPKI